MTVSGLESRLDPNKGAPPPPLPLTSPPAPGSAPGSAPAPVDSRGWRKDERSERSVRDKIAMFTAAVPGGPCSSPPQPAQPQPAHPITRRLSNKFKSTEDVFQMLGDAPDSAAADTKLRSRSVVSVDRIGKSPDRTTSSASSASSAYSSFCSPESSLSPTLNSFASYESSTLPRKNGSALTRATSFSGHPRPSAPAPAAPSAAPQSPQGHSSAEEARRASLIALVEQRRRSISKLRGLVIPDKVPEATSSILDLPEIRSKDAILIASSAEVLHTHRDSRPSYCSSVPPLAPPGPPAGPPAAPPPAAVLTSPPWKSQGASNLPKYSPAFKRKSLTVRSASMSSKPSLEQPLDSRTSPRTTPRTSPRTSPSQDFFITEPTKSAFLSDSGRSAEEESDNDSAVSSSRYDNVLSHIAVERNCDTPRPRDFSSCF